MVTLSRWWRALNLSDKELQTFYASMDLATCLKALRRSLYLSWLHHSVAHHCELVRPPCSSYILKTDCRVSVSVDSKSNPPHSWQACIDLDLTTIFKRMHELFPSSHSPVFPLSLKQGRRIFPYHQCSFGLCNCYEQQYAVCLLLSVIPHIYTDIGVI